MKKSYAMKWVAALRSGKYKQGKGRLHKVDASNHHKYCCLGVLCDVVGAPKERVGSVFYYGGRAGVLPNVVVDLVGMHSVEGTLGDTSLTYLNDIYLNDGEVGPRKNFSQIADIIEKNWRKL